MFKEKADDIYSKGLERRGQFNPDPDSAHLKAYLWWVENTRLGAKPKQENFCHYWRVVLIWTPLIWLGFQAIAGVEWILGKFSKHGSNSNKKPSFLQRNRRKINKAFAILGVGICSVWIGIILVVLAIEFWKNPSAGLLFLGILAAVSIFVAGGIFAIGRIMDRTKIREAARYQLLLDDKITLDEYLGHNKEKKTPGKIRKFFNGVGDFCHLMFQVVRVKKWKICPFVEIPDA